MKIKNVPEDIVPCCELCEYATKMELTGDFLCRYKSSLKKKEPTDVCKNFCFNIFAYTPKKANMPKAFDFTKI